MTRVKSIPCDDCDREKEHLEVLGFQVLGCVPDTDQPGFCLISYQDPGADVAAPPASAVKVASDDQPGIAEAVQSPGAHA